MGRAENHLLLDNEIRQHFSRISESREKAEENRRGSGLLCDYDRRRGTNGSSDAGEFAELTIQELMRDVAYNFRKTNAAIQDIGFEMSDEYFALSNLMLDFANLNMRLEATRLKIEALRDGSLDVHDMMDEDDSPRRKTRKRRN